MAQIAAIITQLTELEGPSIRTFTMEEWVLSSKDKEKTCQVSPLGQVELIITTEIEM